LRKGGVYRSPSTLPIGSFTKRSLDCAGQINCLHASFPVGCLSEPVLDAYGGTGRFDRHMRLMLFLMSSIGAPRKFCGRCRKSCRGFGAVAYALAADDDAPILDTTAVSFSYTPVSEPVRAEHWSIS
jgi:hypothetical protein